MRNIQYVVMITHTQKIRHLLHRTGFGAAPEVVRSLSQQSISACVDALIETSASEPLNTLKNPVKHADKDISGIKLGVLILKSRGQLEKLNLDWLVQMGKTHHPLVDKMTYFWHDHFATSTPIAYLMQSQHNVIRQHALGKFGDLLHSIAKDPAMLLYLNNHQNKKNAPNENFAREVMELFTLSEGKYTEQDIKHAARAFTGWQVNMRGEFDFNREDYDEGEKDIFGKRGKFSGEEVIDMLLENPATAENIVRKIYTFLVNEQVPQDRVKALAEHFFRSDYDVALLLKQILTADWFYEAENIGCLIKPPVVLLAEYIRTFQLEFRNRKLLLDSQKALDQVLFFPPNVAGWPTGKQWIDSSSLLFRMKLPFYLLGEREMDIDLAPEYEKMAEQNPQKKIPKWLKPKVNWQAINSSFSNVSDESLPSALLEAFIQADTSNIDLELLKHFADDSSREAYIKSFVLHTLALPEFQLA